MKEQLQQICEHYAMTLLTDISLAGHTTFHIGGSADFWIEINSVKGLNQILQLCRSLSIPYFIMGRGSNILASDSGYRGLILHLGNDFSEIRTEETVMTCQAGAMLSNAAKLAADNHLTGMEALSGIPGTIGGALCMNAGAYGSEMKDIVISCDYLDADGTEHTLEGDALQFSYRHSFFTEHPGCIVTSVKLALQKGNPEEISAKISDYADRRKTKQPLNFPSAGSTFKRPEEERYASKLIDECGLKGFQVGGAQVSEKHAGFVINRNHATCADVLQLCREVRSRVLAQTGYLLELEPVLLGIQAGELSCS